jgi:alkanesulfonate monooxygenase SsuD/methylene tetrahydromethanopterin reductase-like flavin-dependent oxidoreductase (luciferase family)
VRDPRWQQRQVEDFVDFAALAEELGFDGITVTEHHAPALKSETAVPSPAGSQ